MDMAEEFVHLLRQIKNMAGADFSGVGLLVCDPDVELPVLPMRPMAELPEGEDVVESLVSISRTGSDLHDGFHLLTNQYQLFAVAQYFSPPIPENVVVNVNRKFGGRYLAAQFGSAIKGVKLSGIATRAQGVAVFQNGVEIYYESA
ncbi:hypothetical protein [Pseudomonas mandelii]|uniref:hypothetical protein n=1 Tax=Pseudomonas mandelii TaxID=75612 RepID=UPI00224B39F2|nr:hypothetical protein [Pseudomonas mandelii]MCX2901086.1 hypothetical protein [Pseudomonas mandelii]